MLRAGDSRHYALRVFYQFSNEKGLAFSKPGTYFVKVRFPLPRSVSTQKLESNVIQITITAPQGIDARFWKQVRSKDFPSFLTKSRAYEPKTPRRIAAHIINYPETSYHPSMRYALAKYYGRMTKYHSDEILTAEADLIRKALNINHSPEYPFAPQLVKGSFVDDYRLNAKVLIDYPKMTSLEKIGQDIYAASGVPLYVSPTVKNAGLLSSPHKTTIRQFMLGRTTTQPHTHWVKHGEGYTLELKKKGNRSRLLTNLSATRAAIYWRVLLQSNRAGSERSCGLAFHKWLSRSTSARDIVVPLRFACLV